MEIFGKELKMNTNISPKEAKLSLLIISIVIIIILSFKMIVMPLFDYKDLKVTLTQKETELEGFKKNLVKAQGQLYERQQEYNRQNENYNREKEKFEKASLANDTDLKYMIADIAEYLNIKILEVGKMEISEENEEYLKKTIPYKVEGNINDLGQFFYYLENSNYLISFKDSNLDIQLSSEEKVSVRMEVGAYFNEGRRWGDV